MDTPASSIIERLNSLLESHYGDERLRAGDLCKLLHVSRSTLHYKLKRSTGKSAAEYLHSFRIKKAVPMIVQSDDAIKVIAFKVGFRDSNYFCRVFKKEVGMSPTEYRKSRNTQ